MTGDLNSNMVNSPANDIAKLLLNREPNHNKTKNLTGHLFDFCLQMLKKNSPVCCSHQINNS